MMTSLQVIQMPIKLYIDYGSQPSRAVLALCIINKIPHEVIHISIMEGKHRSKQFAKINPMKLVPAIQDTDNQLCLAQSHAILRYLCSKYKLNDQWYSLTDLAKQAKTNQFLDFHHSWTRKCSYLTFHTLFAPILKTGDPTFSSEYTYKVVRSALKHFSNIYLKEKKFVGGQQPSIADLIAFFDITMLEVLDYDYSAHPNIQAWIQRMKKIEGVAKANQNFENVKDNLKSMNPKAKL